MTTDCCERPDWVRITSIKSNNKSLHERVFEIFACRNCGTLSIDADKLQTLLNCELEGEKK